MSETLTAKFNSRRDAEMVVERLVQEHGVERTVIFVAPEGAENSAGGAPSGSDTEAGAPSPAGRGDAQLDGRVVVSVDIEDEALARRVRDAFGEFGASDVAED